MYTINWDIFLSGDVTKSIPVQNGNLDACSVTDTPREVLCTIVNPDTCRIRVGVQILFESGKKKVRIQKFPELAQQNTMDKNNLVIHAPSLVLKKLVRTNVHPSYKPRWNFAFQAQQSRVIFQLRIQGRSPGGPRRAENIFQRPTPPYYRRVWMTRSSSPPPPPSLSEGLDLPLFFTKF